MKVLVIEDNSKIASLLQRGLSEAGHTAEVCNTGLEGQRLAQTGVFDAIVLDIGLPDRDGLKICRDLRHLGVSTPLLMLTVLSGVCDKVRGLDAGADDYLTKPFDIQELLARLKALKRRRHSSGDAVLKHADLVLDLAQRTVKRGRTSIQLTRREFDLLTLFMRNPRRVLSREIIGTGVWDHNFDQSSNVIDVFIHSLRRKINIGRSRPLIHSVQGVGYILEAPSPEEE